MASNVSLAALYRPQTFAEVVGQDMVKSILSRAAREDRVAPAYLLSGTRGVGKTTIARIFAKALNCEHAPVGEPCNQCDACRRITQGSFVDVVEIDGASNRGIDDIRRLRDAVGYAPLEGRYKVFIIDEAHMLTKEAFNALLKTLEEPPARVTFILATTEQHKFPVTIVSRCQNFVFRQIPEPVLESHICDVLNREGRPFEPEAARLIARRAAGSVRDSMSLLGQVLALGCLPGEPLTSAQARDVLGLAGSEMMSGILDALAKQDAAAVTGFVRELLAQGADMGFFIRELGSLWRNLFIIRQAGADASEGLDLPPDERARLVETAGRFTLAYIHAAWQMTLESQRRILTSLEPASGLELLLLNLCMLPRLLPLEELGGTMSPRTSSGQTAAPPTDSRPPIAGPASAAPVSAGPAPRPFQDREDRTPVRQEPGSPAASAQRPPLEQKPSPARVGTPAGESGAASPEFRPPHIRAPREAAPAGGTSPVLQERPSPAAPAAADAVLTWESFLDSCGESPAIPLPMLRQFSAEIRGDRLTLSAASPVIMQQLQRQEKNLSAMLEA
ncbi:MAG: DNA polymerase III subunit gamma/tau, partial [Mailhella sp.]|nr:DNA polymerase III subunit gamma/tau [Mailhella sp.]